MILKLTQKRRKSLLYLKSDCKSKTFATMLHAFLDFGWNQCLIRRLLSHLSRKLMSIWCVMTTRRPKNDDAVFVDCQCKNQPRLQLQHNKDWEGGKEEEPLLLAVSASVLAWLSVKVYWCFDCDQRLWLLWLLSVVCCLLLVGFFMVFVMAASSCCCRYYNACCCRCCCPVFPDLRCRKRTKNCSTWRLSLDF